MAGFRKQGKAMSAQPGDNQQGDVGQRHQQREAQDTGHPARRIGTYVGMRVAHNKILPQPFHEDSRCGAPDAITQAAAHKSRIDNAIGGSSEVVPKLA
ncbi:MAG: hypothetical protein ABSD20_16335 [Terriglobales bacterium]